MTKDFMFGNNSCLAMDPLVKKIEDYTGNIIKTYLVWATNSDGYIKVADTREGTKRRGLCRAYTLYDILSILDVKYIKEKIDFNTFFYLIAVEKELEAEALMKNILISYVDNYIMKDKKTREETIRPFWADPPRTTGIRMGSTNDPQDEREFTTVQERAHQLAEEALQEQNQREFEEELTEEEMRDRDADSSF